jgi:iron(III) transport system substrate-binding protein
MRHRNTEATGNNQLEETSMINRLRRQMRLVSGVVAAGAMSVIAATSVLAADASLGPAGQTGATAELVAAAKKEGAVNFYGVAQQDAYDTIFKAFMKDYPEIKARPIRVRTSNFLERVLLEHKAGEIKADVMHASSEMANVVEAGAIEPYLGVNAYMKERFQFPPPEKLQGLVTDAILTMHVVYNTSALNKNELPKSWEDLTQAKWKGKLGLDVEGYEWFAAMWNTLGAEKADKIMKGLAGNVVLREGATHVMELMVAGEFPIAIQMYGHRTVDFQQKGAPVDVVRPLIPPVAVIPSFYGVSKKSANPNAGKLVLHWLASDSGQAAQAAAGRIPVLKGFQHPVLNWLNEGGGVQTYVIHPGSIDYTAVAKQFNSYFVRK